MTAPTLPRAALIISTTPPVPREYGNRNRVFQTMEFLRRAGFAISFILYALDEEWEKSIPPYYAELASQFDYFTVIPNSRPLHQRAAAFHHTIDEWWDENIGEHIAWLCKRKNFDVLFVNYTFLSKAFTYAPAATLRILDTHDIFTDRRETFGRYGVEPEFFYTNAEQESLAFARADAIIAIKASEADFIRTLTAKHVVTIPYWDSNPVQTPTPRTTSAPTFSHERPLRLGFIGAQNSVNVVNLRRFLRRFDRYVKLYNLPVEIIVAGNVCRQLHETYPFLKKLGRVENIAELYDAVDAIVAPLEFSTGIKIKVGEALVWHLPVLATHNAFDGFGNFHRTQTEPSVAALCDSIADLAHNQISFGEIAMASRRAARAAAKAQQKGFDELRAWIRTRLRRILFVSDRPFWHRGTFVDETITHTLEFVSHIAPVAALAIGHGIVDAEFVYANATYISLETAEDFTEALAGLTECCNITVAILFIIDARNASLREQFAKLEAPTLEAQISRDRATPKLEFQMTKFKRSRIIVTPLRYVPPIANRNTSDSVITIFCNENRTEWQLILLEFIGARCDEENIILTIACVPNSPEFDENILVESMSSPASRIILLASDALFQLFVLQAAYYRHIGFLILTENYAFPQATGPDGATPSIEQSIDAFLAGSSAGTVASGADTGWSEIWNALEAGFATAA